MTLMSLLIHEPGAVVSLDGFLPGASYEDAFDLGPHGFGVAEAGPQRRPQVGQRVEQPVVCRPTPQLLPGPLDGVQPRAVTGQSLELQVWVVPQRLVDRPAAV